jgi:hypothetical protein
MLAELDTLAGTLYASADGVLLCEQDCDPLRASDPDRDADPGTAGFARSRALFEAEVRWLGDREAAGLEHGELEARLQVSVRELHRQLLQDHLDLRALREEPLDAVVGGDGARRGQCERGHQRPLGSVFGPVSVTRNAYRARGWGRLFPADAALNLPDGLHSHGLRRLAAIESARGSFDDARDAICRATGQVIGKRQLERLAHDAAVDFQAFYAQRPQPQTVDPDPDARVQVISCDGKGIVMRPGALRAPTQRQAERSEHKLATRLSRGEKRNRKRIAEVGAVYEITPVPRTARDILPASSTGNDPVTQGPVAKQKWLTASVSSDAAAVIAGVFDEAHRRDPNHTRKWIALVDGNNHQIDRITREAAARGLDVPILIDFVHVIEYLWKAAWCFHPEGDPAAEGWVHHHAQKILAGHATRVAGAIRRQATNARLDASKRAAADTTAKYLTSKSRYLDYPTALTAGWPIATGVIEGQCRHLVKDRMDITGARWGLPGAEAILKLRAIHANHDFEKYWAYHLTQEHRRVHQPRYAPPDSRPS